MLRHVEREFAAGGIAEQGGGAIQVLGHDLAALAQNWLKAYLIGEGRGVAVVSTGPDGVLDTNIDRLWSRRDVPHAFDGDDTGSILVLQKDGEAE